MCTEERKLLFHNICVPVFLDSREFYIKEVLTVADDLNYSEQNDGILLMSAITGLPF